MKIFGVILLVAATTTAREYTDAEISSFPRLFHLDDYDRCLARTDGLYCLGTFDLTPSVQPHPTYELLKAYSDESYRHFNRTRIHRGYCVSSRCPHEAAQNASQRFERCVNEWAQTRMLRASINTFNYCHTHADKHAERPRTSAQTLFLQCVYAIITINFVATIYDVYTGDNPKKNKLITAFSIPANWKRLTVIHETEDPRIATLIPLSGFRVIALMLSTMTHAPSFYFYYTQNPENLEKLTQNLVSIYGSNGTALIQALMMVSCFLTGYLLLIFSQKMELNLTMLPHFFIKRAIRLLPVNMLIIGFAATWWVNTRDGPLVPATIGLESRVCQSKFWSHMFFTNNMVDSTEICVTPTWFLPVDMHMSIVACILTLIMWRHRRAALKLYPALFLASCAMTAVVAYNKGYKSFTFLTEPESIRVFLADKLSYTEFYTSSWAALPSCFLGLTVAHIHFEIAERRINLSEYNWFVYLHYLALPLNLIWPLTGIYARRMNFPIFYALHAAFYSPIFCIIVGINMLGIGNIDGFLKRLFGWSGFVKMSRLSLTVMLLHWCVNASIAARPVINSFSILDVGVDWLSTYCITHVLAVPITIMVEIPTQKFLTLLMYKP